MKLFRKKKPEPPCDHLFNKAYTDVDYYRMCTNVVMVCGRCGNYIKVRISDDVIKEIISSYKERGGTV